MNEPTLHPNLAKLAAAYDEILERLTRGQISTVTARSEIAQLEARDDQGVRWNIDPDTGEWVRKTALGDYEYDPTPPTSGYMTPDAFDYTQNPQVFNPSARLELGVVSDDLGHGPTSLAGATRHANPRAGEAVLTRLADRAATASTSVKTVAVAAILAVLATGMYSCSPPNDTGTETTIPTPATSPTQSADSNVDDSKQHGGKAKNKNKKKKREGRRAQGSGR